jgi:hypothetical protein
MYCSSTRFINIVLPSATLLFAVFPQLYHGKFSRLFANPRDFPSLKLPSPIILSG